MDDTITALSKGGTKKESWLSLVKGTKSLISYQIDKKTNEVVEGALPTLFAKLKTDNAKSGANATRFSILNNDDDDIMQINELPIEEAIRTLQKTQCKAISVIHIESIFISNSNLVSIQTKLHEALITEVRKSTATRLTLPARLQNRHVPVLQDDEEEPSQQVTIVRRVTSQ
jgi:hypothetical protein